VGFDVSILRFVRLLEAHLCAATQKVDTANREETDIEKHTTPSPNPNEFNSTAMSYATKNGDVVTQTTHITKKTIQENGNGITNGGHKVTTLRDATQRAVGMYRTELGSSAEQFLDSCNSVEIFFDFVAGIRLREMPHPSSRWDKILKWAEFFAAQVYGYSEEVSQFADYSQKAAQIIWAACRSLLEVRLIDAEIFSLLLTSYCSSGKDMSQFWRRPLASSTAAVLPWEFFSAITNYCTHPRSFS
jgi:hypothetical protein